MLLTFIKLLHTIVFLVMSAAILFLLYCGLTGQISRWTGFAFALVMVEVVIYVGNGFLCPLKGWADNLTPAGQPMSDIYLPRWIADRVVTVSTPILVVACLLIAVRLLQGG
jgi:hypothetical protein